MNVTENPAKKAEHQLRYAEIIAPGTEEGRKTRNELKQAIEQIRSVEFKPQNKTAEPVLAAEQAPAAQPNEISPRTPQEPDKEINPKLPYEPVTDQTLQMLENLLQHPDQAGNPFELAEILFLSGHPEEAAVFYREAFTRKSSDKADPTRDKAWILFQTGNCLRNSDPQAAKEMYRQLITEYPDSPWTDLAKSYDKLVDWYLKDKPISLIAENRTSDLLVERQPNSK